MHDRFACVKQLSELQQGCTVNGWAFRRANAGANDFVKHPCRDATCGIVGEPDIDEVPLAAGGTEYFEWCSEQRMKGVAKF